MNIELISHTHISVLVKAIRKCYDSQGKSDSIITSADGYILGARDANLISRIIDLDHTSTLEHINYTFEIDGISRACLQELVRHRHASYSVKSTRYTLKELAKVKAGSSDTEKFLVHTGDKDVDTASEKTLGMVIQLVKDGISNDIAKMCLPESFKTSLIWTINARSLRNFFELRLAPQSHWEIQTLAYNVYQNLPKEHKILFKAPYINAEAI